MSNLEELMAEYENIKSAGLKLNIQRGQPGDENFDLVEEILTNIKPGETLAPSGIDIRNYPGGPAGLKDARDVLSEILGVKPEETIAGNNSSLKMMANTLMWAIIRGLKNSPRPWGKEGPIKFIVTVPGYDRHFYLLENLNIGMETVNMTGDGPDIDEIEKLAASNQQIKGLVFVPTYSNPTGDIISDEKVKRLASMKTAAPDFTIFADDAYAVHHLTDNPKRPLNLLRACQEAGNPDRAILFGSTSKITFSGAGVGVMGCSQANLDYICGLIGSQTIGPDKVNQYRHSKFIRNYPGGLSGLMKKHAEILKPKFDAVRDVLTERLGESGLAEWSEPKGGYFVCLRTKKPCASRVVELMKDAGVALTPAGATHPYGKDPGNDTIRISPTRPSKEEVKRAMEILALCVKIASAE